MSDSRTEWLEALRRLRCHVDAPGSGDLWCPEYDAMPRERLRALQSEKLRLAVRYMNDHSPLFAAKLKAAGLEPADVRGVDDLSNLPITTKEDMSRDLAENPPYGGYTAVTPEYWDSHGWMLFNTSGTTAQPRTFRYTDLDREMWTWTDARALWAMGIRPGDRALLCFGYGPHVAMWGMLYGLNLLRVPVIPSGGMDSRARARVVIEHRPTVIAATPSFALYFAGVLRELEADPAALGVRKVIALGEPVPEATLERIRREWGGAAVAQFYGCTEAAPSCGGYTCSEGLHLMEDTHLIETVDPETLQPVPTGERGLTVITNLCSEASPQVRFLVGDYTTLSYDSCACGRTHVRTSGWSGRADDMLNIRGVTLFPSGVEDLLRGMPELGDEFQIVLERADGAGERFELVVERKSGDDDAIRRRVEEEVRSRWDLQVDVKVVPLGTLPKTEFKAKRVRDLRA